MSKLKNSIKAYKNKKKLEDLLKNLQKNNDPISQLKLGILYYEGIEVEKDEAEAFMMFLKAAKQNNSEAQYLLGYLYQHGSGYVDLSESFKWYKKAAMQNHLKALKALGDYYAEGLVVEKDIEKAKELYKKAASKEGGETTKLKDEVLNKNDKERSKEYLNDKQDENDKNLENKKREADNDNKKKENKIKSDDKKENKIKSDEKKENNIKCDEKKAKYKNIVKNIGLIMLCFSVISFGAYNYYCDNDERNNSEVYKINKTNIDLTTEKNLNKNEENNLNKDNFDEEMSDEVKYFELKAKQGIASAQNDLAYSYYWGEGVKENREKAVYWYKKAAEQGYTSSECNLANCYYRGHGVKKDIKKAVYWYKKAANKGVKYAEDALENIEYDKDQVVQWHRD